MDKQRFQNAFALVIGAALILLGAATPIYYLIFTKPPDNAYEFGAKYLIPLAYIYFGWFIFRNKNIPPLQWSK